MIVLGCAIPSLPNDILEIYCNNGEKKLTPYLSQNELFWLNSLKNKIPSSIRIKYILSRLLLIHSFKSTKFSFENLIIDRSDMGYSYCNNFAINFSYSENAAFCAINFGKDILLGLDAEYIDNSQNISKVRLWTIKESLVKAIKCGLSYNLNNIKINKNKNNGSINIKNHLLFWKTIPFPNHWCCIATNKTIKTKDIICHWLNLFNINILQEKLI